MRYTGFVPRVVGKNTCRAVSCAFRAHYGGSCRPYHQRRPSSESRLPTERCNGASPPRHIGYGSNTRYDTYFRAAARASEAVSRWPADQWRPRYCQLSDRCATAVRNQQPALRQATVTLGQSSAAPHVAGRP